MLTRYSKARLVQPLPVLFTLYYIGDIGLNLTVRSFFATYLLYNKMRRFKRGYPKYKRKNNAVVDIL